MAKFGRSWGRQTVVRFLGGEIRFRFDNVELDQWAKYLADVGLAMEDMEPVFDQFGQYLVEENIPATFKAKGRPRRWAKLSRRYSIWKHGAPGRVANLVLSGRMRQSFRWNAFPRSLRIESSRKVGKWYLWQLHQFGTRRGMPARVILQLMRQDKSKFLDLAHEYIHHEPRVR